MHESSKEGLYAAVPIQKKRVYAEVRILRSEVYTKDKSLRRREGKTRRVFLGVNMVVE
jgi:hypothetical protein